MKLVIPPPGAATAMRGSMVMPVRESDVDHPGSRDFAARIQDFYRFDGENGPVEQERGYVHVKISKNSRVVI